MATNGLFKRCSCRDTASGQRIGVRCPRLTQRGHGSWYFRCYVRDLCGWSVQVRRGGFSSEAAARAARAQTLSESREHFAGRTWTVGRWLRYWLTTRHSIRPTTLHSYTVHVEKFLIPAIGGLKLAEVTGRHLTSVFAELAAGTTPTGQPRSVATVQRIRATLRAAFNAAIRDGLVTDNPARRIEMPSVRRPHAVVWTHGHVERWRVDGQRPQVAVWTTAQAAQFLQQVAEDELFALWWLVALRGLRRGEVAGLRWCDVDLDRRQLTVVSQRTTIGYRVIEGPPKSAASRRTVALDRCSVEILHAHRARQWDRDERAGRPWRSDGYVFTRTDGRPYHPNVFTKRLRQLTDQAGLPPIRLHDLRHGAASLAHEAGVDLKTVQDQLGHASIVLTADTYTSVLPVTQRKAAEATARLILTTARAARAAMTGRLRPGGPPRPQPTVPVAAPGGPPPANNPGQRPLRKGRKHGRSRSVRAHHKRPPSSHRPHRTR